MYTFLKLQNKNLKGNKISIRLEIRIHTKETFQLKRKFYLNYFYQNKWNMKNFSRLHKSRIWIHVEFCGVCAYFASVKGTKAMLFQNKVTYVVNNIET